MYAVKQRVDSNERRRRHQASDYCSKVRSKAASRFEPTTPSPSGK
jgi:hypothetical protein